MSLTLNQIVSRLRTLALSHKQLNSFYFGDVPEFDANGDIIYPACFAEQQPGSVNRTEKQQRFNMRLFFVDLVNVSQDTEGNETEVLSDMTSVANDFLAMLMYSEYEDDWLIADSAIISPITESLGDMVAGVILEVGILVDYLADRCQVPSDDVTFESDFDMARTRMFSYTATGSEGSSFTPTDVSTGVTLANRVVLTGYRAGSYKRIITTVPTDTENIRVVGTDLGNRKGILSTTGAVGLSSGDALVSGEILDFIIWE